MIRDTVLVYDRNSTVNGNSIVRFMPLGMTELGGIITCQMPHHKNGSCGVIKRNAEMKIMDPISGKSLGPKQPGELWTKSATIMNGYYRNPAATKDTIDKDGNEISVIIIYH